MSEGRRYDLTADPIFFVTFGFFAVLTTLMPAALGQANFLPILQALALTIFVAIPLRRGRVDRGIWVITLWIGLQLLVMSAGSALLPQLFERAVRDGFSYHRTLLEWSVTGEGLPGWLLANPLSRLGEIVGVLFGSLLTAGLAGLWFLMRAVNQFGYAAGTPGGERLSWVFAGLDALANGDDCGICRICYLAGPAASQQQLESYLLPYTATPSGNCVGFAACPGFAAGTDTAGLVAEDLGSVNGPPAGS